jgi:hypothetical protein
MDLPSSRTIQHLVLDLAAPAQSHVFIESGTFMGSTTRWASEHFGAVFTIERHAPLFHTHSAALRALGNVTPLLGDSRDYIATLAKGLNEIPAVYWLDAHWSGQGTAGEGDECPLIDELAALAQRSRDVILIDDARLFLCAPPLPHRASDWPRLAKVIQALGSHRHVQIVEDVIVAIPDDPTLVGMLTQHAQRHSTLQLKERQAA